MANRRDHIIGLPFITPKFDDCRSCRHFNPMKTNRICGRCGIGEHFVEKEVETELTDTDLWKLYAGMPRDDD